MCVKEMKNRKEISSKRGNIHTSHKEFVCPWYLIDVIWLDSFEPVRYTLRDLNCVLNLFYSVFVPHNKAEWRRLRIFRVTFNWNKFQKEVMTFQPFFLFRNRIK